MQGREYLAPCTFAGVANSSSALKGDAQGFISTIRVPLPKSPPLHIKQSNPAGSNRPAPPRSVSKLRRLRRSVGLALGQLVVSSWAVIGLSYALVNRYDGEDEGSSAKIIIELGLYCLSLYQTLLVVLYWHRSLLHSKTIRKTLGQKSAPTLRTSRLYQVVCFAECLFHMILPYPGTYYRKYTRLFGQNTSFSISDMLFALLNLRQYHILRLLYWLSPLPTLRVHFHYSLWDMRGDFAFRYKYLAAQHHLKVIGCVYGLMVIISGFVLYGFEHAPYSAQLLSMWDGFWLVGLTQTTVGYGDVEPSTFPGKLSVLVSCGVGICLLGLLNTFTLQSCSLSPRENDMYMAVTSRVLQRKHRLVSVVLLQRWWKLELYRRRKHPNLQAVLALHSQLAVHRRVRVGSININVIRLERQVRLCTIRLARHMKYTKDLLEPVINVQTMVSLT